MLRMLRNTIFCKHWQFHQLFRKPSGIRWLFSKNVFYYSCVNIEYTNRLFGRKGIFASLSGVHRELSWLLSVVRDTESDMRDGDEQLLLFWLLLATVSSSKESASFPSSDDQEYQLVNLFDFYWKKQFQWLKENLLPFLSLLKVTTLGWLMEISIRGGLISAIFISSSSSDSSSESWKIQSLSWSCIFLIKLLHVLAALCFVKLWELLIIVSSKYSGTSSVSSWFIMEPSEDFSGTLWEL